MRSSPSAKDLRGRSSVHFGSYKSDQHQPLKPLMICAVFALTLVGALATTAAQGASSSAVGTIVGSGGVNANGAATYNIPITLPPGTHSMQPSLALVYDSQSGEGLAGYGWSISGLSAITRCPATMDSDGLTQAVQLNGPGNLSDDFCLDGQRLRSISGVYGADGTTYGTEIEGFSRITSHGSSTGPSWFTVQTKDGRVYEYGNTTDSKVYAHGTTVVRSWALDRVTDLNNNYMTYQYHQDTADGDYWPLYINYTGNVGIAPDHQVEFDYEARPTVIAGYIHGSLVTQTQRLTNVKINYAGATTFNYTLGYQTANATGRSDLTSVTECGADGTCLPATTITWRPGQAAGWGADTATPASVTNAGAAVAAKLMDVDGDGVMDLVYPDNNPNSNTWKVLFGNPNGGFSSTIVDTGITASSWYGISSTLEMDYNGDGLTDLAVPIPNNADGSGRGYLVMISQGTRTNPVFRTPGNTLPALQTVYTEGGLAWAVDFHGSGSSDLVYSDGSSAYLYTNQGGAFSARQTIFSASSTIATGKGPNFLSHTTTSSYSDTPFNFDGSNRASALALDTYSPNPPPCIPEDQTNCGQIQEPTYYYWDAMVSNENPGYTGIASLPTAANATPVPIDVDADGLTDLLYTGPDSNWRIAISTGTGFGTLLTSLGDLSLSGWNNSDPVVADYYGDGKQDAIVQTGTGQWTLLNVSYTAGSGFGITDVSLPGLLPNNYQGGTLRVGNIEADGLSDLVYAVSNSAGTSFTWHYKLHSGVVPDLVSSITDGMGNFVRFQFASLASGAPLYTKGNSAQYPVQDVQPTMQVVSTFTQSDGIGGSYNLAYAYSGAQLDPKGRGFLGFATVTTTDSRNSNQDTVTYDQVFPWIGQVTNDVVMLSGSGGYFEIQGSNKNGPDYIRYGSGYLSRYFPYFDATVAHEYDPASVPAGTQGSQVRKTVSSLAASVNNQSSVSFDAYGNTLDSTIQVIDSTTGNTFTSETIANFNNDYDLGTYCVTLPVSVTVKKTPPSGASASRIVTSNVDTGHCQFAAGSNASSPSTTSTSDAPSSPSVSTSYTYDGFGNVSQTVISGTGISSTLTTGGRTTSATFTGNGEFSTTYNAQVSANVALTSHATWRYDFGVQATTTDPNGLTTTTQYDGFGRPIKFIKPDGTATTSSYQWCAASPAFPCPSGTGVYEVTTTQIPNDGSASINTGYSVYDASGRVVEQGRVLLGGVVSKVDTTYDRYGHVISVTQPFIGSTPHFSTTYGYFNQVGKLHTENTPSPQDPQASCYPTCQDVTTFSYSGFSTAASRQAGNAADLNDGATQAATTVADALGRTVQATDAKGGTTSYGYDASGNAVTTTDAGGKTITMSYDGLGHKVGMLDPNMGSWSYQVDALGEMLCQTDANSQSIIVEYDNVGRIVSKLKTPKNAGCNATTGVASNWNYDAPGALGLAASMGDSNGYEQTYTYDTLVRPSSTITTISGTSYAVSTTYDNFGRVQTTTYPVSVAPTANGSVPTAAATATPTLTVTGTVINLDGSGSTDPNGAALQYQWTQTGGPALNVGSFDSAAVTTSFTPAAAGVYSFQLQVIDSSSALSAPVSVSVTVKPQTPAAPTLSPNPSNSGNVTLSWHSVPNVASYAVYQSTNNVNFTQIKTVADGGTGTNSTTITGLANGTYYFALTAAANSLTSAQSPSVMESVVIYAPTPTGLTNDGDPGHTGTYVVSWNSVTAAGTTITYDLEQATGNSSGPTSSYSSICTGAGQITSSGGTSSCTAGHPGNGSYYYYYEVRAYNLNGYSAFSGVSSIHLVVRPGVPGAFSPSTQSNHTGTFTIAWGASTGPVAYYQLFQDTSTSFSTETWAGNSTSTSQLVNEGLGTWYFRTRACNSSDSLTVCSDWQSYATANYTAKSGGGGGCPPPPYQCQLALSDEYGVLEVPSPAVQPAAGSDLKPVDAPMDFRPSHLAPVDMPVAPAASPSVLMALAQERLALVAVQPRQPGEAVLQARADRHALEKQPALLPPAAGRDVAAWNANESMRLRSDPNAPAFEPPAYIAYASAHVASVTSTPYQFEVKYSYDPSSGSLVAVSDANTGFIYWRAAVDSGTAPVDAFGHILGYVDGNNVSTVTAYDPGTGIVTGIGTGVGQSSAIQQLIYTWDGFGNLRQRCDANKGLVENFTYDGLNRMATSAVKTGGTAGSCSGITPSAGIAMTYDAVGNILTRSNTGLGVNDTYSYGDPSHPYAVTGVTSMPGTYQYDANGNMFAGNGRAVTWNDDNLPTSITSTGTVNGNNTVTGNSVFSYGPDRQRYSQTVTDASGNTTTTTYIGNIFEVVTTASGTQYRHSIMAGGGVAAIHTIDQSGNAQTNYIHGDHLGSSDTLTADNGTVSQEMSFDAFGLRRDPTNWAYDLTSTQITGLKGITDRGYTYQEQLDNVGLVHMNGRVYDPSIGRMISADPVMAGNRYAYVDNNPLARTDPSGYCWAGCFWQPSAPFKAADKLSNTAVFALTGITPWDHGLIDHSNYELEHNQKVQLVVAIALSVETGGASLAYFEAMGADAFWAGVAEGAVAGATMSATMGTLNGQSPMQVVDETLRGAATGAVSAGLLYGANSLTSYANNNFAVGFVSHGVAGGLASVAAGGSFKNGFKMGAFSYSAYVAYQGMVNGQSPTWASGKGIQEKDPGFCGCNENIQYNNVLGANTSPASLANPGLFNEGGPISNALNDVPGLNSVATLHDVWADGLVNNIVGSNAMYYATFAIPTVPVAMALTYGALVNSTVGYAIMASSKSSGGGP